MSFYVDLASAPGQSFGSLGLSRRTYHSRNLLLLVDWDDTCFPTTYFERYGITHPGNATENVRYHMRRLERRILRLIDCHTVTDCAIVTTASQAWIEDCLSVWMPTLRSRGVAVLSASDEYGHVPGSDSYDRKLWAFRRLHGNEDSILVVGDGPYEKWAASVMENDAQVSMVAFIDNPRPTQLIQQLEFTHRALHAVTEKYQPAEFILRESYY